MPSEPKPTQDTQTTQTEQTAQEESRRPNEKSSKFDLINKEWAATIIFSGAILLLIMVLFIRHEQFTNLLSYVLGVLRPITIGLIISFILYRPTCQIERVCNKAKKRLPRFPASSIAVLCSYLLLLLLLSIIIWIVVPQFIESIQDFADNILVYWVNIQKFLNSDKGERIMQFINENGFELDTLPQRLFDLTEYIPMAIETVSSWIGELIGGVIDFFIGLIFSIYVLAGRHKLHAQGRQIMRHYLPPHHYRRLSYYGRLTFTTFSNFISGQLIDAFILGVLIFFAMTILGLEYPMMIAVILGITNMIPYVGPWIGTVPCAAILLLVDPWHAVIFVIMVVVVQQIDGNVIYPRVVGSTVGLPAIWVLFAITVGGGLFGIAGMIIGVPIMSIVYTVIREKTAPGRSDSNNPPPQTPNRRQLHPIRYIRKKIQEKKQ